MDQTALQGKSLLNYGLSVLWTYKWLLVVPTLLFGLLAFGFALTKKPSWTATQSFIIRDDLVGDPSKPGRFESQESLKSAQETIQEIVRKPIVLKAALEKLGAEASWFSSSGDGWPDASAVEDAQDAVAIRASNGTEFGKSEVVVLTTKASSSERARQFALNVIEELEARLKEVREARIGSMTGERELIFQNARRSFDESAAMLQKMEVNYGSDLTTVRSMTDTTGGDGPLQKSLTEVLAEKRAAESALDLAHLQRQMMIDAQANPGQLTATSNELLQMQPRLSQLVAGLNGAEIELAKLVGKYRERHPDLINGREEVIDIKKQILDELGAAVQVIGTQIEVAQRQYDRKAAEEMQLKERLSQIAGTRVEYSRLEQEVQKKSQILATARERLSELGSVSTNDSSVQLLTLVGGVQVPTRADGPGLKIMTGLGLFAGLLTGLGLIILFAPSYQPEMVYQPPPIANELASRAMSAVSAVAAPAIGNAAAAISPAIQPEPTRAPAAPNVNQRPAQSAPVPTPFQEPERTPFQEPARYQNEPVQSQPAEAAPAEPQPVESQPAPVPTPQTIAPVPAPQAMAPVLTPRAMAPEIKNEEASAPVSTPEQIVSSVQRAFAETKDFASASPDETPPPQSAVDIALSQLSAPDIANPESDPNRIIQGLIGGQNAFEPAIENQFASQPVQEPKAVRATPVTLPRQSQATVVTDVVVETLPESEPERELSPEEILQRKLNASIKPSAEDIVREIKRRRIDRSAQTETVPADADEVQPSIQPSKRSTAPGDNPFLKNPAETSRPTAPVQSPVQTTAGNTGIAKADVQRGTAPTADFDPNAKAAAIRGTAPTAPFETNDNDAAMRGTEPTKPFAEPASETAEQRDDLRDEAKPIPDQIKLLSKSIAAFCEPLNTNDNQPTTDSF